MMNKFSTTEEGINGNLLTSLIVHLEKKIVFLIKNIAHFYDTNPLLGVAVSSSYVPTMFVIVIITVSEFSLFVLTLLLLLDGWSSFDK